MHLNRAAIAVFGVASLFVAFEAVMTYGYRSVRPVGAQQLSSTPSTIMAGPNTPAAAGITCDQGKASSASSSLYNQTGIAGNSIWKCATTDGVTYAWQAPFTAGNQLFYGPSGVLTGGKCWYGTVTSNTSGQATVNWSSAGFAAPPVAFVQPYASGTTAANAVYANPSSVTATSANITVTTPATVSVLGALSVNLASAAYTLAVQACGN